MLKDYIQASQKRIMEQVSNFYTGNGKNDWLHCNSIDYNSQLDQIIISSRTLSEFWIIDHSTTTDESADHSVGNSEM